MKKIKHALHLDQPKQDKTGVEQDDPNMDVTSQQQQRQQPQQQQQQFGEQQRQYRVIVPEGIAAGQTFVARTPEGMHYMVAVPPNMFSGQTITINVPVPPSSTTSAPPLNPSAKTTLAPPSQQLPVQSSIPQLVSGPQQTQQPLPQDVQMTQAPPLSGGQQDTGKDFADRIGQNIPGLQPHQQEKMREFAQQQQPQQQPSYLQQQPPSSQQQPPFQQQPSYQQQPAQQQQQLPVQQQQQTPQLSPQQQQPYQVIQIPPQPIPQPVQQPVQQPQPQPQPQPQQQQVYVPPPMPQQQQQQQPQQQQQIPKQFDNSFVDWRNFQGYPYQPVALGTRPAQSSSMLSSSNTAGGPSMRTSGGRKKALVVGINYAGSPLQLRGSINDARSMQSFLLRHGFPDSPSTLLVLTDDSSDPNYVPTHETMIRALQWLVQGASPGDSLFFHFSGHGAQQPDYTGIERDGLNETILPVDFQYSGHITDDMIWDTIAYPLPSGCRLTVVLDCCYSGTGIDMPYEWSPETGWHEMENPCLSEGDVQVFSGVDRSAPDPDTFDRFGTGGAITTAFITAMESQPPSSYSSLMSRMTTNLSSRGFSVLPCFSCSQRFDPEKANFDLEEGILPNNNIMVGKTQRTHFSSAKPNFKGTVLEQILQSNPIPLPSFASGLFRGQTSHVSEASPEPSFSSSQL